MQRDFLKFVFVVLLAFLSLGVASAQGPKEQTKHAQTAKTGSHHHSSSKPKTNYTYTPGEAVDLGLSVKWSSVNLGATKPEEYGDYFAWGEIEPKSSYSWSTYKWCNGEEGKLTKYCPSDEPGYWDGLESPDNRLELLSEDDAARAIWGGNWRMPTNAEFEELLEKCNKEWTTYKGVNGWKFTSKKNSSNWIFLPAAGSLVGPVLYNADTNGYYWSSSLKTDDPDRAWYLLFNSGNVYTYRSYRRYGQSVRPVSE